MISLTRNSKGKEVAALGLRSRKSSIYSPGQSDSFRISRSKFSDFLTCVKCFYLDRVKGIISPSLPGWTLNETTDLLLKKEFDVCREHQISRRVLETHGLNHIVPLKHPDIDVWRDSLKGGIECDVPNTNLTLHGGIDDVWYDTNTEQIVVVDYKSQASKQSVIPEIYLSSTYRQSYKIQLEVYGYIFQRMGFSVAPISYFYVCNANRNAPEFAGHMDFTETLVPYELDYTWVESKLLEMSNVLNSQELPKENPACENCAYSRQRTLIEAI